MNHLKQSFLVTLVALASLTGCSYIGLSTSDTKSAQSAGLGDAISGILISYNRSTVGRTDYEQYRLVGSNLIWECGRISAGRYNPQTQRITKVGSPQLENIKAIAADIHRLVTDKGAKFSRPGSTPEFFDPGQYRLVLEKKDSNPPVTISTTFDSVAVPQANREHLLNKLTVAVRNIVVNEVPCGIKEFYHLATPSAFNNYKD